MSDCKTEDAIVAKIRSRGVVGREKYGASMDRKDLSYRRWLIAMQEEMMDGIQYAERNLGAAELLEEAFTILSDLAPDFGAAERWVEKYREQFNHETPSATNPDLTTR